MLNVKKFYGKIITKGSGTGLKYLDQLSDEIIWVSRVYINRYLDLNYHITQQQYYNLVIYGNINYIPKCPYCNNPRKYWRLINGYYTTCSNYECISNKHSIDNKIRWSLLGHGVKYEHYCKKLGMASGYKCSNKAHLAKWLSMGNPDDECYFYIASTSKLKFGITYDTNSRKIKAGYHNIKVLFKGSRLIVGNLEYLIKNELCTRSEYIDWHSTLAFRVAFNKFIKMDLTNPLI